MIYLKIIDNKGKELNLSDLTDTGIQVIEHDCRELLRELNDRGFDN